MSDVSLGEDKVGIDLMPELIVGQSFRRAEEAVASIVDDDIDPAEFRERPGRHGHRAAVAESC